MSRERQEIRIGQDGMLGPWFEVKPVQGEERLREMARHRACLQFDAKNKWINEFDERYEEYCDMREQRISYDWRTLNVV